jgi:hypothetical protein
VHVLAARADGHERIRAIFGRRDFAAFGQDERGQVLAVDARGVEARRVGVDLRILASVVSEDDVRWSLPERAPEWASTRARFALG